MDNKELLILFPDLRHGWFDTKIKKPMEPYLHDSSNVISTNAITANAMKKSKLGEAGLMSMIFLFPQVLRRKFTLMILCLLFMMIIMIVVF